jgi:hypothetical protein
VALGRWGRTRVLVPIRGPVLVPLRPKGVPERLSSRLSEGLSSRLSEGLSSRPSEGSGVGERLSSCFCEGLSSAHPTTSHRMTATRFSGFGASGAGFNRCRWQPVPLRRRQPGSARHGPELKRVVLLVPSSCSVRLREALPSHTRLAVPTAPGTACPLWVPRKAARNVGLWRGRARAARP